MRLVAGVDDLARRADTRAVDDPAERSARLLGPFDRLLDGIAQLLDIPDIDLEVLDSGSVKLIAGGRAVEYGNVGFLREQILNRGCS